MNTNLRQIGTLEFSPAGWYIYVMLGYVDIDTTQTIIFDLDDFKFTFECYDTNRLIFCKHVHAR